MINDATANSMVYKSDILYFGAAELERDELI